MPRGVPHWHFAAADQPTALFSVDMNARPDQMAGRGHRLGTPSGADAPGASSSLWWTLRNAPARGYRAARNRANVRAKRVLHDKEGSLPLAARRRNDSTGDGDVRTIPDGTVEVTPALLVGTAPDHFLAVAL
jgi:hypothetical protein